MGRKPKKSAEKTDYASLSDRQRRILNVISDAVMLRGYPPSIREIGDAAGLQSTSSVAYQLKQLEEKGFLRRDPNKPRAVDVRHLSTDEGTKKPGRKPAKPEQQVPEDAGAVSYILWSVASLREHPLPLRKTSTRTSPCLTRLSAAATYICCR